MENNYAEVLDLLMKERKEKKRKPTNSEQLKFHRTWLEMTSKNGFDNVAESYLYNGFSFCESSAYVEYLLQCNNPEQELLKLMKGKRFSQDSNTTFRVLINILALLLNEKASPILIVTVMTYLPKACLNKEGKPLGTAPKSFEKYFLSKMNPFIDLPALSELSAEPAVLNRFCTIISELLDEVGKAEHVHSAKIPEQITLVRKWLNSYASELLNSDNKTLPNSSESTTNTEILKANKKIIPSQNTDGSDALQKVSPADQIIDLLAQIKPLVLGMDRKNTGLEANIDSLKKEQDKNEKTIQSLEMQIMQCNEQIENLKNRLAASETNCFSLRKTISEREAVIQQKNDEIAERIKMADILSRDRARQSSEIVQKLSSRIRVEYRDFVDAKDLTMTCDLGENLRLQLQSIFDILEKGGMQIK